MMDEEKLAGDEQSGGPAMPLTTFVTTTFWAVAQEAVRRTARRIAHCSDYEDVISESMLALYQRWCTGGGINDAKAYASQVARSVVRKLRRRRSPNELTVLQDLATREGCVTFDELVSREPEVDPQFRGRVQSMILSAVLSGQSIESISLGDPKRLKALRFQANAMAARLVLRRRNGF
jgi:hypothetical protein